MSVRDPKDKMLGWMGMKNESSTGKCPKASWCLWQECSLSICSVSKTVKEVSEFLQSREYGKKNQSRKNKQGLLVIYTICIFTEGKEKTTSKTIEKQTGECYQLYC